MSRDDVEAHERACRSLIELGHAAFPVIGPADRAVIGVYGAALVARIVGTIEAMLTLGPLGRDADLKILVRSAFEHSVTFAWIAADPERRFARWQKEDAERRIEAHRGPRAPRREPPCSSTARGGTTWPSSGISPNGVRATALRADRRGLNHSDSDDGLVASILSGSSPKSPMCAGDQFAAFA